VKERQSCLLISFNLLDGRRAADRQPGRSLTLSAVEQSANDVNTRRKSRITNLLFGVTLFTERNNVWTLNV